MKQATRWVALTCLVAVLTGCQTSPESAADHAAKRVDQEQRRVDRMDHSLDK